MNENNQLIGVVSQINRRILIDFKNKIKYSAKKKRRWKQNLNIKILIWRRKKKQRVETCHQQTFWIPIEPNRSTLLIYFWFNIRNMICDDWFYVCRHPNKNKTYKFICAMVALLWSESNGKKWIIFQFFITIEGGSLLFFHMLFFNSFWLFFNSKCWLFWKDKNKSIVRLSDELREFINCIKRSQRGRERGIRPKCAFTYIYQKVWLILYERIAINSMRVWWWWWCQIVPSFRLAQIVGQTAV